jgi:tryptophan halogenase
MEAAQAKAAAIFGAPAAAARQVQFENGMYRETWRGNCVAMGSSAGFLEPLAATGLRLIDEGVARLVGLFPDSSDMPLMATEYNRLLRAGYESARDFVLLHHALGPRGGALTAPPPSLSRRLELFRHRGRVLFQEDEIFEEAWWACACIGLGIRPQHFSILAEQMSEDELLGRLSKITRLMRAAVDGLPTHRAYLHEYLA